MQQQQIKLETVIQEKFWEESEESKDEAACRPSVYSVGYWRSLVLESNFALYSFISETYPKLIPTMQNSSRLSKNQ